MEEILELLKSNMLQILAAIITAVASYIGVQIKNAYTKYVDTKTKKEIVKSTVEYVEQVSTTLKSEEKFAQAKAKAVEWLNSKGISISDTEIEILIESAVNALNKELKKDE